MVFFSSLLLQRSVQWNGFLLTACKDLCKWNGFLFTVAAKICANGMVFFTVANLHSCSDRFVLLLFSVSAQDEASGDWDCELECR
jgi:hypothetical protein